MATRAAKPAKTKPVQYTIRGVPPDVDRALRRRAADRRQSLNQLILEELASATQTSPRRADFTSWIGGWTPDPEFEEILREQRQIDWDMWR